MSAINSNSVIWTPRVEDEGDKWADVLVDLSGVISAVITVCTRPLPGEECDKVFWYVSFDFAGDNDTDEGAFRDGWANNVKDAKRACVDAANELLAARKPA